MEHFTLSIANLKDNMIYRVFNNRLGVCPSRVILGESFKPQKDKLGIACVKVCTNAISSASRYSPFYKKNKITSFD